MGFTQTRSVMHNLLVRFEFEPRDLWVGVYWKKPLRRLHLYICLIPTLVIHVEIWKDITK